MTSNEPYSKLFPPIHLKGTFVTPTFDTLLVLALGKIGQSVSITDAEIAACKDALQVERKDGVWTLSATPAAADAEVIPPPALGDSRVQDA